METELGPGFPSFAAFVTARQAPLLRSAYLACGDHHLAEDLLQDALTKLALRWDEVRLGAPEAYVRTILYRDMVSWRRRLRRERLVAAPVDRAVRDGSGSVDDRLLIQQALDQLTDKQRAVLVLRYFDDYSEEQTAQVLQVSVGTVKSHAHAALRRLRECAPELAELLPSGGDKR